MPAKAVLSVLEEAVKFSNDIDNDKLANKIQAVHDHLAGHKSDYFDKVLFSKDMKATINGLKKGMRNNLAKHTKALAQQIAQRSDTNTTDVAALTVINSENAQDARTIESLTTRFQTLRPQVKKVAEQLSPPPQSPYEKL